MECTGCGARRAGGQVCPFCGHDSAFERLHRAERGITWFWRIVLALVLGSGFLIFVSLYSAR